MIVIIFLCVIFSVIVGLIGSNRKIGFWIPFLLSLFLTPIIGIIVALCSKSLEDVYKEEKMMQMQAEQLKIAKEKNKGDEILLELEKLATIRASGILTDEEFQKMKDKIMSQNANVERKKYEEYNCEIIVDEKAIKYHIVREKLSDRERCNVKFENNSEGRIYSVPGTNEYAFIASGKYINYENEEYALAALYKYLDTFEVTYKGKTS